MGDRAMCQIKQRDGSLYVYTHWGGGELPEAAEQAIVAARYRWDDESYATRIIIDQLIKEGRDQETGFGVMVSPRAEDEYNGDEPSVVIDLPKKTLEVIRPRDGISSLTAFGELVR